MPFEKFKEKIRNVFNNNTEQPAAAAEEVVVAEKESIAALKRAISDAIIRHESHGYGISINPRAAQIIGVATTAMQSLFNDETFTEFFNLLTTDPINTNALGDVIAAAAIKGFSVDKNSSPEDKRRTAVLDEIKANLEEKYFDIYPGSMESELEIGTDFYTTSDFTIMSDEPTTTATTTSTAGTSPAVSGDTSRGSSPETDSGTNTVSHSNLDFSSSDAGSAVERQARRAAASASDAAGRSGPF